MDLFARYHAEFPPGFEDKPLLFLMTIFSLLLGNLLVLEWMWRLVWAMGEKPLPLKHPASAIRWILFLLLLGIVIRSAPDAYLYVRWSDLSEEGRASVQMIDAYLDSVSFLPMSLAWLGAWLGGAMISYQISREPLPVNLWPTWSDVLRPLKIGVGVLVLSIILTFLP